MKYPKHHKAIVSAFIDGKFIVSDDPLFEIIKKREKFYVEFFEESFGYQLCGNFDYYHLESDETAEHTSRDISIFFAILCYELDKDGKAFLEELNTRVFEIEEIINYFSNSTWREVINANKQLNTGENLSKFVTSTLAKRNLVRKESKDQFSFTKAHRRFIDFARNLVENSEAYVLKEEE